MMLLRSSNSLKMKMKKIQNQIIQIPIKIALKITRSSKIVEMLKTMVLKCDLEAYSHDSCVIKTSTNPLTIEFVAPDDINLLVKTLNYDCTRESSEHHLVEREVYTKRIKVEVSLFESNRQIVRVYSAKISENYQRLGHTYCWYVVEYLIVPTFQVVNFIKYPKTAGIKDNAFNLLQPRQNQLSRNKEYEFNLIGKENVDLISVIGIEYKRFNRKLIDNKDNVYEWTLSYTPNKIGTLDLGVNGRRPIFSFEDN